MKILVTAGNTQTPVDRVRCITNVFTGRTGAHIAARAAARGHRVTLVTSHPDALGSPTAAVDLRTYRTFDDLERLMADLIVRGGFDAVVHAAAVNDYHVAGVYAPGAGTRFDPAAGTRALTDAAAGKVKSHHAELWLRLVPAPKLVDKVRRDWGFAGTLVKFKLEVGASDVDLLDIAERSRRQSGADLMAANTLEGMHDWAYVGGSVGYRRVRRDELAGYLVEELEKVKGSSCQSGRIGLLARFTPNPPNPVDPSEPALGRQSWV
jgi:phosphopantothenoylcysteine synthetase/decarboxylase